MREFRRRGGSAVCDHLAELLVLSDLPLHLNPFARHSAAVQGLRRKAGPQHDAVWFGVARGHAKGEWILGRGLSASPKRRGRGHRKKPPAAAQKRPAEEVMVRHIAD